MSPTPHSYLIVAPPTLAEGVAMQPLLSILKARHSEARIDVLAVPDCIPLLQRMPEVDRAITLPVAPGALELGRRYGLGQALQREHYARAWVLDDSFLSALIPFFAGIPVRTGWRGQMRFILLNDIRLFIARHYPQLHQRFAALGGDGNAESAVQETVPLPALSADTDGRAALWKEHRLSEPLPLLVLALAETVGRGEDWVDDEYVDIATDSLRGGEQVALLAQSDSQRAHAILERLGAPAGSRCVDLTGRLDLAQTTDLMSGAAAVVGDDAGLLWLAASLRRPLVAVNVALPPSAAPALASDTRGGLSGELDRLRASTQR